MNRTIKILFPLLFAALIMSVIASSPAYADDSSGIDASAMPMAPSAYVDYHCTVRHEKPYDRQALLTFTLEPGSYVIYNWFVTYGIPPIGIGSTDGSAPIVFNIPALKPGVYTFQAVFGLGDQKGAAYDGTFEVNDDCSKPPFPEAEPVVPPAPTFVDECGTDKDGVVIPAASAKYTYFKLGSDGFDAGTLQAGFNAWTGNVIVSPYFTYYIPGGTQTVWTPVFTDVPCQETSVPDTTVVPTSELDIPEVATTVPAPVDTVLVLVADPPVPSTPDTTIVVSDNPQVSPATMVPMVPALQQLPQTGTARSVWIAEAAAFLLFLGALLSHLSRRTKEVKVK